MKVYFWQNMPSHIQALAIEELALSWPDSVHCVWADAISADRAALSWTAPEMPNTKQCYLDSKNPDGLIEETISQSRDDIHIFSGLDGYPSIKSAFMSAKRIGASNLALMVEPGIQMGWRGQLRPLRARILARKYLPWIKLVLAMGQTGVNFYRNAGFSDEVLFPYMYQAPVSSSPRARSIGVHRKLLYIGKFTSRKGLDVLIRAIAFCRSNQFSLNIVGGGPEEPELRSLCDSLNVQDRVHWEGVKSHDEIVTLLADADLCIVPSRFEGWGVVTNEAIGAGTPVICSDRTTSKDLVAYGNCGRVFRSEDPADLATQIDDLVEDQCALEQVTQNACDYRVSIAPSTVAGYLQHVLEHRFLNTGDRPAVPWER